MTRDEEKHGQYVRKVSDDTRRYAQKLLAENEKLRLLLSSLESQHADPESLAKHVQAAQKAQRTSEALRALVGSLEGEKLQLQEHLLATREELERFREDRNRLQKRLATVEEESRDFSEQYARVEQETSGLANLYVASYRLHGTVERAEVLGIIQEIVASLVGCEELAVFELDADDETLRLIDSEGIDPERWRRVRLGAGVIGHAAQQGEVQVMDQSLRERALPAERDLTACIPLKLGERLFGAIALFRLLPQKDGLDALDHELFDLLATHAATALYCSGLHARLGVALGAVPVAAS